MVKGKGIRLLWTDKLRVIQYPKDPYCRFHITKNDKGDFGQDNWTDIKLTEYEAYQVLNCLQNLVD